MSLSLRDYPATYAQERHEEELDREERAFANDQILSVVEHLDRRHAELVAIEETAWRACGFDETNPAFVAAERNSNELWAALEIVRGGLDR